MPDGTAVIILVPHANNEGFYWYGTDVRKL
jgi:hypothetical protein